VLKWKPISYFKWTNVLWITVGVKVNWSLCTPWSHMKVGQLRSFLSFALERDEWSAASPWRQNRKKGPMRTVNRKMGGPQRLYGHFEEQKYILNPSEYPTACSLIVRPLSSNMRSAMSFYVTLFLILLHELQNAAGHITEHFIWHSLICLSFYFILFWEP
jgi:hypothetical protein